MAIQCPGCGRRYDPALFEFGRTIHCTCGARVGREQRIGSSPANQEPRFIADAMLGRVARWLRTLGYDTVFNDAIADFELVRRALLENRILLTRDRRIPEEWRIDNCLILDTRGTQDQLAEVVSALGLPHPDRLFTRCRHCNVELEPIPRAEVADGVPTRVLERTDDFFHCPECERVYWRGSHTERMSKLIDRVFDKAEASG